MIINSMNLNIADSGVLWACAPPLPFSDHKFQSYMYSDEFIESYMMMREKCVNKEKLFNEYYG